MSKCPLEKSTIFQEIAIAHAEKMVAFYRLQYEGRNDGDVAAIEAAYNEMEYARALLNQAALNIAEGKVK